ncbi:MAG TPA: tyrosine-type recombinase/integrase [Candidatus Koribacter sp.]|jgi:integrase
MAYRNGKCFRETTKERDQQEAQKFLNRRLGEIATGTYAGPQIERVRVSELADEFLRDYRINGRKSLDDVQARWDLHLKPFFGDLRACEVTSDLVARYVDQRQQEKAKNATINRELAALKRMYHLGYRSTPPKVLRVPTMPRLQEDNIRKGFLTEKQYEKLVGHCSDLWFRSLIEVARTYGWRRSELLSLRVRQVDLLAKTIRLEPGTTKNKEGREVTMTQAVLALISQCVSEKGPDDFVFTREKKVKVKTFLKTWKDACKAAGVTGLLFHDLRRTAARNLRNAGVAEGVIMKIGGWRTRSVFERYAIVSQSDIRDALRRLDSHRDQQRSDIPEQQAEKQAEEAVQ